MPLQNRSGTSTVKCQSARDTIIQMKIAILVTVDGAAGLIHGMPPASGRDHGPGRRCGDRIAR
jgi:hypothetical protein